MKVRELFERAQHPNHVNFARAKLSELKSSLWMHDLSVEQIKRALNHAFEKLMVRFVVVPSGGNSAYARAGLGGAEYSHDGWVTVEITDDINDVLNGDYAAEYEDFASLCAASIGHELTHREQALKHPGNMDNVTSPNKLRDYLSDHREIESFAVQTSLELLAAFDARTLVSKLSRGSDLEHLAKFSDCLGMYLTHFEPQSPTIRKLLKKLHVILADEAAQDD